MFLELHPWVWCQVESKECWPETGTYKPTTCIATAAQHGLVGTGTKRETLLRVPVCPLSPTEPPPPRFCDATCTIKPVTLHPPPHFPPLSESY